MKCACLPASHACREETLAKEALVLRYMQWQSGRVIGSKKVSTIFHTILITRVLHARVVKSCFAELPIRLLLGLRLQIHSDPWEFQDPKMETFCGFLLPALAFFSATLTPKAGMENVRGYKKKAKDNPKKRKGGPIQPKDKKDAIPRKMRHEPLCLPTEAL